jgi:hypothetical protein
VERTGGAPVRSSAWFGDQNVHISKISGPLSPELAVTAGLVTTLRSVTANNTNHTKNLFASFVALV